MGVSEFLRRLRSSKKERVLSTLEARGADARFQSARGPPLRFLPQHEHILKKIFTSISPHSTDATYDAFEQSTGDTCLMCDINDLAHCSLVCKTWSKVANEMLYSNIRIDTGHYCGLDDVITNKRKRKTVFGQSTYSHDPAKKRLQYLAKTVRENQALASYVRTLKLPYWTRETCTADIARTVSMLPKLKYIDLPEAFYNAESSTALLRRELQAKCRDIRAMKYDRGSESSFAAVRERRAWPNMENLELLNLNMDSPSLLTVLQSFSNLSVLMIDGVDCVGDLVFKPRLLSWPAFPPLRSLTLKDCPNVTFEGLVAYLNRSQRSQKLISLAISSTGVTVHSLHKVLAAAPSLITLSFTQSVSRPFEEMEPPLLSSTTLQNLHYEVTKKPSFEHDTFSLTFSIDPYYHYLVKSFHSAKLPALVSLYVRDADFVDKLMLAPPIRSFSIAAINNNPFIHPQTLYIYTKGANESGWNFRSLRPRTYTTPGHTQMQSTPSEPLRLSGLSLSTAWRSGARTSVIIGDGLGRFLTVPSEERAPRPKGSRNEVVEAYKRSSSNKKRSSDLWGGM